MATIDLILNSRNEILELASKYGCTDVRIFGSVSRGDERDDSDIDFLVNIDENHTLLDMVGFQADLQKIFHRKVDVVQETSLHWFIKKQILGEAKPI